MKVLDSVVEFGEVWFKVKLDRNTDVLAKELFTADDVKEQQKQAVKEFCDSLYNRWENNS